MNRGQGRSGYRAIALGAVIASLVLGAPAAGAAQPSGVAVAPSSVRRAAGYWTPARMRRARPLDVRVPGRAQVSTSSPDLATGAPREVPPRAPGGSASASSSGEAVPDPTVEGLRQNGVIFFEAEGFPARCSGTSVSAGNLSVVFTAGHCVNSGGRRGEWYDQHWVFVPGYRFGQLPFGIFPARWLDATGIWLTSGSENGDVAAAVVGRNERGQRLGAAVGGAGIAWNRSPNQVFDVRGYPVAPPFDGETQQVCPQTAFLGHDLMSIVSPGPLNLAVDCDFTGGSSGGGWMIDGDVLNSVTNYGYPDDAATEYGAYFGREVARLYGRAARIG